MRTRFCVLSLFVVVSVALAADASAMQATRDIKIISSAGARAMADACTTWAEQNKQTVAMAILDWGGNLIESHAMEGAPMNSIDTALLKAKSALRWRRPTSETNKQHVPVELRPPQEALDPDEAPDEWSGVSEHHARGAPRRKPSRARKAS